MARLAESDYRQVLEVLREAAAVDGPLPFPKPLLRAFQRLIPCDVVAYHDRLDCLPQGVVWTGEPRGVVTEELRDAQRRYRCEDPLKPGRGAQKYSDFLTSREFHRTGLYREVAKPLGVEDMFRLWLHPSGASGARLEFDRPRRNFCERDRAVLDVLLPHLQQFRRNAAVRRRVSGKRSNGAVRLTAREHQILELVAEGKTNDEIATVLWLSRGTVRKHLENTFEKLGVHTRTAAVAAVFSRTDKTP